MIKTMTRISTNSIHPNDPNINHSLSFFCPTQAHRPAALNQSNGGGLPHTGKGYRRTRTESSRNSAIGALGSSKVRKNPVGTPKFYWSARLGQARSVWSIWFVLFIWLIWFVWLVSFNQKLDKPDRPDNDLLSWWTVSASS
jgi:hypothetical protein